MEYATQMDAARKGIVTKEMEIVAKKENIDVESLRQLIAKGQVIIPANKNHKCLDPNGIGNKLRTKINVNLGTSRDCVDLDMELDKVNNAVKMGAEAIMDLSSFGDTQKFRRKLTSECPATIGTVPIYDAVVYYHKALKDITAQEWLDVVEMHAKDGVDFMTIHCGINKATAKKFRADKRLMNIVSRGGSIIYAWMEMTGNENPFFEYYDRVLEICREYDVTMSLGDACRRAGSSWNLREICTGLLWGNLYGYYDAEDEWSGCGKDNQGNEKKGCQEGSDHCNVCKCLCRRHYQQPAGWNECSSCKAAGCGKNDCCLKTMHGR